MNGLSLALLLPLAACGGQAPKADPQPRPAPVRFEQAQAGSGPAAVLAHGERLASVLGCKGCHGADLHGRPWDEEADLAISFSTNLTRALPSYSDATLERAIREGVRADGSPLWGMPSEIFTHLDPGDLAALIAYLRTLRPGGAVHPRIVFGPRGRRAVARGEYRSAPDLVRAGRASAPPRLDGRHELARYISRATCGECHGLELSGRNEPAHPPPDLIMVGGYSRAQFRHLLRTGEPAGGRRLVLMDEVSRGRFVHLTGSEVDALYDYLVARARQAQ